MGKLLASTLANLQMEMVLAGNPKFVPIATSSDVLRVRINKVINVHLRRRSTFLGMAKEDKLAVQVEVYHGRVRRRTAHMPGSALCHEVTARRLLACARAPDAAGCADGHQQRPEGDGVSQGAVAHGEREEGEEGVRRRVGV